MILAGTGHRPEKTGGYSDVSRKILYEVAKNALIESKPEKIISGMALGWDQALAEAAIDLGIPFIAAIPFVNHGNNWPSKSRMHNADLLAKASRCEYICQAFSMESYQKRNEWMVDQSDGLIAFWNGDRTGGTWNCLEYAKKVNKPVVHNCYDAWVKYR